MEEAGWQCIGMLCATGAGWQLDHRLCWLSFGVQESVPLLLKVRRWCDRPRCCGLSTNSCRERSGMRVSSPQFEHVAEGLAAMLSSSSSSAATMGPFQ